MPKADDLIPDNAYSSQVKRVFISESDGTQVIEGTTSSVTANGGTITINADISPRNKCFIIYYDIIASASTDFDVEIYPTDAFTTNEFLMKDVNNNLIMKVQPASINGDFYIDRDETNEMHIKITNNDTSNASTFTYKIYYKV